MRQPYKIIGATEFEEILINNIISYIAEMHLDIIKLYDLYEIEILDKLSNDSSGRSIEHKMFLSREYALSGIPYEIEVENNLEKSSKLKRLVSTVYHELWHISTWDRYREMYEYVISVKDNDDSNIIYTAYSYMYWIEYVAHIETVFIEDYRTMKEFCENFVNKRWEKIEYGYSYFVKALPYYIVRARYINEYESLTEQICCKEIRYATMDFKRGSEELFNNEDMTEKEKSKVIEGMIRKLFV